MVANETVTQRSGFIVLLTGALYFAQGVPLGIAFSAYPAILREAGASLAMLAWLPLVGLPWMLKFLWSPIVDNKWIASVGRRRTWLLSQQLLMVVAVLLMGALPVTVEYAPVYLALFSLASVFAATQDIATDGLAAERLHGRDLLNANTLAVSGMILGMIVGGGGLLMAAGMFGIANGFYGLGVLLMICIIPTWLWREDVVAPVSKQERASLWVVRRPGFGIVLVVTILFAAAHTAQAALTKLMLVDLKWGLAEIGSLETVSHLAMMVLGCGVAPWMVGRLKPLTCLCLAQFAVGASSLALLAVAVGWLRSDAATVFTLRAVGSAGAGLAAVAGFTVMTLFAKRGRQAGTDMTVFKSANVLGEIAASSIATSVASMSGYSTGFAVSIGTAVLTLVVLLGASRETINSPAELARDVVLTKGAGA